VLRAALAMRMDYAAATRMAASIGQALAFGMGFIGLFSNPFLLFIALFIWVGAAAEASETEVRNVLSGIPVRRAMLTDYATLAPADTLARAIDLTMAGTQKDFPVMEGGRLVGVLRQADMLRGLREQGETARVGTVMHTDIPAADIDEPLEDVLERLRHHHCRLIPIMASGRVAGLVDLDNISELLQIHAALHGQ
jgi:CBS domain-containing protein